MAAAAAARIPLKQVAVRLARRPVGAIKPGVDLVVDRDAPVTQPADLKDGEVLVKNCYLSLDPAMRGWMTEAKSYVPPVELGAVMRGGCVGEVVASKSDKYSPGQLVTGMTGWQSWAAAPAKDLYDVMVPPGLSPSAALGVLGMTGQTAYHGLLDVGKPVKGETVVVSAAAGATGSVVAQIAKHVVGCYTVGIAGGKEKCDWLRDELGLDAVVDYKASTNIAKDIAAAAPKGIDVYFDNVGGEILDACLRKLRFKARVVLCGAISQYNAVDAVKGPANYLSLLVNRARMEGFIVFDYAKQYREAGMQMAQWIQEGKLTHKEDVVDVGLEGAAEALCGLYEGRNKGKLVVKIADPSGHTMSKL